MTRPETQHYAAGPDPSRKPSAELASRSSLVGQFLKYPLIAEEDWELLPEPVREALVAETELKALTETLVEHRLLTPYQASRICAGKTFGLVLGNFRVCERIGAGGMGIVFKGEHICMRRLVAIKVLSLPPQDADPQLLGRFYCEMRAVAQLEHPNIVSAFDAGKAVSEDPDAPVLHYFVMEYLAGQDLEEYVLANGPLPVARACELIYQVASALDEAHKHNLVHRDIKPSNILVTAAGQAKLLDFGLARHFRQRLTQPGMLLGSVDYMAPEQVRDSSSVDIRADIYGLGGVLFWCLNGRNPFPPRANLTEDLLMRLTQQPPSARVFRPDVPAGLDALLARMMALPLDERPPHPQAVMRSLLPYLRAPGEKNVGAPTQEAGSNPGWPAEAHDRVHRVLIVDDEKDVCALCQYLLQSADVHCETAANGPVALETLAARPFDLVLLDNDMPGMSGTDVVRALRQQPPGPYLKIIMISGRATPDEMAQLLQTGVDDFVSKPFSSVQLRGRVRAALRLRDAQLRSDRLNQQLLTINAELEKNLTARDSDLVHVRNALVLALAKLVESRHIETGKHLLRMQHYCRILSQEAARLPALASVIDGAFIEMLECCAPLHDIGKVALPDHILLKPGKLTVEERLLMQTHTTSGAETLQEVARQHGTALAFLQMAIDITRHHHERFDGHGYPDRLAGDAIPLSARLVALADVYDALRSRRVYKPALAHAVAVPIILEGSEGQFDPMLLPVFERCAPRLEQMFNDLAD